MPVEIGRGSMTAARLAAIQDERFQYEIDNGELAIMAPAGEEHGRLEGRLFGLLFSQIETRGLGVVYTSDTAFVLRRNPDVVRSPDIAFVRMSRFPPKVDDSGFIVGGPDLAVEIQSPSQSAASLREKTREYLESGAEVVWIVRSRKREVAVFARDGSESVKSIDDMLSAPAILPGIAILVRDIFRMPGQAA